MTLCGLVLPWTDSYHHSKVLQPLTSSITTHAMTFCPIGPYSTDNQTIKLGRRMMTKNPFDPD